MIKLYSSTPRTGTSSCGFSSSFIVSKTPLQNMLRYTSTFFRNLSSRKFKRSLPSQAYERNIYRKVPDCPSRIENKSTYTTSLIHDYVITAPFRLRWNERPSCCKRRPSRGTEQKIRDRKSTSEFRRKTNSLTPGIFYNTHRPGSYSENGSKLSTINFVKNMVAHVGSFGTTAVFIPNLRWEVENRKQFWA